jgi:hypothetical protein
MLPSSRSVGSLAIVAILLGSCTYARTDNDLPASPKKSALPTLSQYSSHSFAASGEAGSAPLYAGTPIKADRNGKPRVFRIQDIGRPGVPILSIKMRSTILGVSRDLLPEYRKHLAFLFAGRSGQQFLVVFLEGYPRYPVLNVCAPPRNRKCLRVCPLYVDPDTRRVIPSTNPTCADSLPIWANRNL